MEDPDTSADIVRQVRLIHSNSTSPKWNDVRSDSGAGFKTHLVREQWTFSERAVDDCELDLADNDLLIDLAADSSLRLDFNSQTLDKFWISLKAVYPSLHAIALPILLNFSSTYLCASGFSSLLYIKNKYRSKLEVEPPLLIKLSSCKPRIAALCTQLQAHPSH